MNVYYSRLSKKELSAHTREEAGQRKLFRSSYFQEEGETCIFLEPGPFNSHFIPFGNVRINRLVFASGYPKLCLYQNSSLTFISPRGVLSKKLLWRYLNAMLML